MAKKQKVNKTQAVRDYLKAHSGAKSSEIAEALTKKGIKIAGPRRQHQEQGPGKRRARRQKQSRSQAPLSQHQPPQSPPKLRQCPPTPSR